MGTPRQIRLHLSAAFFQYLHVCTAKGRWGLRERCSSVCPPIGFTFGIENRWYRTDCSCPLLGCMSAFALMNARFCRIMCIVYMYLVRQPGSGDCSAAIYPSPTAVRPPMYSNNRPTVSSKIPAITTKNTHSARYA